MCGFFFLETLGMWRTMQVISAIYLVAALILQLTWNVKSLAVKAVAGIFLLAIFTVLNPTKLTMQVISVIYLAAALILPLTWNVKDLAVKAIGGIFILLLFTVLDPTKLPVSSVDKMRHQEEILETWQGSDCTVAVARDAYGLSIKINSHYSLGSTGAFMQEKLQADIPLMIYPKTESIFFLGMGTGITAGSALDEQFPSVKRIVACELVPEVIIAAEKYMTNVDGFDTTGGLFTDPRATVLAEDGRHYLMAAGDSFDMINADLFVPYRSGAGSLYSKEHFETVKESLQPGGVFFQWLPLYQVTENEFSIIARTMLEVFDQVSLWRNNFQPGEEVVVFAGHKDMTPLPACSIDSSEDKLFAVTGKNHSDLQQLSLPFNSQTILFFYCGNLTEAKDLFAEYPVNTDDKPVIEYMAPRSYRNRTDGPLPWFVGPRLARLVEKVQSRCPLGSDPLLVNRTAGNRRLPAAGANFHRARIWEVMRGVVGSEEECKKSWQRFLAEWTDQK
jgi:spermidine synthase